jgi:ABC-type polar amino acid transport system ATPase subunit
MSFGDWPNETIKEIQRGLLLIGWRADMRLTDDDASLIQKVALEAIQLHKENQLTPGQIDRLAVAAHDIMEFQVMNVDERTTMASGPYSESKYFVDLVRLIDEATLCYWRGYDTAALATLFIVLESYLLLLYGWTNVTPRSCPRH